LVVVDQGLLAAAVGDVAAGGDTAMRNSARELLAARGIRDLRDEGRDEYPGQSLAWRVVGVVVIVVVCALTVIGLATVTAFFAVSGVVGGDD
jgi:hypothetical protein